MYNVSKYDWKLFQNKLQEWQKHYMERLVKDYVKFLNNKNQAASDKFWELEKRIKKDKKHPGVMMQLQKSEMVWDIVYLIKMKVISYDDLTEFSDDLKQEVKRIFEMHRG